MENLHRSLRAHRVSSVKTGTTLAMDVLSDGALSRPPSAAAFRPEVADAPSCASCSTSSMAPTPTTSSTRTPTSFGPATTSPFRSTTRSSRAAPATSTWSPGSNTPTCSTKCSKR
ncbi:hypothetical protein ACP70R_049310 [Stipagrostis hirtigluma subsp. patula]